MPIVGEQTFAPWAWQTRSDRYTTWEINIPPSAVYAKTSIANVATINDRPLQYPHIGKSIYECTTNITARIRSVKKVVQYRKGY
jgi:hypothetical protein